jgi:D-lactate dehydrogenase
MPASSKLPHTREEGTAAVYFPACINRIFGGSKLSRRTMSLAETFVTVSERAGYPLFIPPDATGVEEPRLVAIRGDIVFEASAPEKLRG